MPFNCAKLHQVVVVAMASTLLSGCGGGSVSKSLVGADRCVEWVFEAPTQWGDSMFGGGFAYGAVNSAALTEDGQAVVVLTNYGGSWGWLEPCNAFLLDITTGRTLGHVRGPYDTGEKWYLDNRTALVQGTKDERRHWFALDLGAGSSSRVTDHAASRPSSFPGSLANDIPVARHPRRRQVELFRGGYYGMGPFFLFPRRGDDYYGTKDIGNGRRIICDGDEVRIQSDLGAGRNDVRLIGRLAKLGEPHVLANDQRRLVFSTGAYLICIDARDLPGQPASSQATSRSAEDGLGRFIYAPEMLPQGVHLLKEGFGNCKTPWWTANPKMSGEREYVDSLSKFVFGDKLDSKSIQEAIAVVYVGPQQEQIAIFGFILRDEASAKEAMRIVQERLAVPDALPVAVCSEGTLLAVMLLEARNGEESWKVMRDLFQRTGRRSR